MLCLLGISPASLVCVRLWKWFPKCQMQNSLIRDRRFVNNRFTIKYVRQICLVSIWPARPKLLCKLQRSKPTKLDVLGELSSVDYLNSILFSPKWFFCAQIWKKQYVKCTLKVNNNINVSEASDNSKCFVLSHHNKWLMVLI